MRDLPAVVGAAVEGDGVAAAAHGVAEVVDSAAARHAADFLAAGDRLPVRVAAAGGWQVEAVVQDDPEALEELAAGRDSEEALAGDRDWREVPVADQDSEAESADVRELVEEWVAGPDLEAEPAVGLAWAEALAVREVLAEPAVG